MRGWGSGGYALEAFDRTSAGEKDKLSAVANQKQLGLVLNLDDNNLSNAKVIFAIHCFGVCIQHSDRGRLVGNRKQLFA